MSNIIQNEVSVERLIQYRGVNGVKALLNCLILLIVLMFTDAIEGI